MSIKISPRMQLNAIAVELGHNLELRENGPDLDVATCKKCLRHGFVERKRHESTHRLWGQVTELECDGGICELNYREESNA